MHLAKALALTGALASTAAATIDQAFADRITALRKHTSHGDAAPILGEDSRLGSRSADAKKKKPAYLTSKSKKFVVDGTKIPEVPFDVGESYAGLLPISNQKDESRQLYFWFFPSEDPKASDEITIWLNGGPGCSSLSGLLTENGPFTWEAGTLAPVKNTYAWNRLTNVVWIEQPVGTGFSQGKPNIKDEKDLAEQFKGFWKNFVDTFDLKGRKVYLTGESYAGMYVPYIANSFLEANDKDYFNTAGIAINDPVIGDGVLQSTLPIASFVDYWSNILGLNADDLAEIHDTYDKLGYTNYTNEYFTFPPKKGPFPPAPQDSDITYRIAQLLSDINPCFNIYHVNELCPTVTNWLGAINGGDYVPTGLQPYFNRTDVQKAINAPVGNWGQCDGNNGRVFPQGDASDGPALDGTLANIAAKTNNVIIGSGALDYLLPTNGTLFALQNTTWNGGQGFQKYPSTPFFVPEHDDPNGGSLGGAGNLGVWIKERGVTFYDIRLAGHEVPGYAASAGYRVLQNLIGRVPDFSSKHGLFH